MVIETQRLRLEAWGERYLEEYLALLADPVTMSHLGGPRSREEGLSRFAWNERHWRERGFGPLWIVERAESLWAGLVGLRDVGKDTDGARPGDVEIGWIVAPFAWGRGYATEAGVAMTDRAFGTVGLDSIIARTAAANAASVRVAEKLGMRLESESPDGVWRTYRLTRKRWRAIS